MIDKTMVNKKKTELGQMKTQNFANKKNKQNNNIEFPIWH